MVNRQMVIIAFAAALLASTVTLVFDRIVFQDPAAAELRREAAQQQSDEAAASRWMAKGHDPGAPF